MEKRQLDLNAPLLSARRHSSPSRSPQIPKSKVMEKRFPSRQQSLPSNRSDWESEAVTRPVTRPGCVPFHWEQSPGRCKDDVNSNKAQTPEPLITPGLPPGKVSDAFKRYSGEVPRLPPATIARFSSGERMYDQSIYRPQVEAFSFNDHASLLERLSESLKCKDETDSESECDAYSDALDTLMPEASGSMKCSVSGISGCNSSDVKTSGTFCIDTDTRDFMMSRFLRAAKAVVVEAPEYAVKKPPVVDEQPKPMKKSVSGPIEPSWKHNGSITLPAMEPSPERHSLNSLPFYNHGAESQEYQEPRDTVKKPGKFSWGIFGRSCVKNALCLLSPLPGMKLKSRTPSTPPTVDVSRFARKTQSGPIDKSGRPIPPPPKKKFFSGFLSGDMLANESMSANDPNQFSHPYDPYNRSGESPMRRYRSGNVSPYRNEIPKSPFREGAVFLGVPKEVENSTANKIASSRKLFKALQDVSRNPTYERGSTPTGDIVEKTVYIDKSSYRKSGPAHVPLPGENMKVADGDRDVEDGDIVRFDQNLPCLNTSDEGGKHSPKFSFTNQVQDTKYALDIKPYQSLDSRTSECIKQVSGVEHEDGKSETASIMEYDSLMKSPLPPPLPKSPSESWLWRTLPSMNLGNPFAHSRQRGHLQSKKQPHKVTASDVKWETVVKTTNINHHGPYSQEIIPHSSHRQRKSLHH